MPSFAEIVVRNVGVYLSGLFVLAGVGRLVVLWVPAFALPILLILGIVWLLWTYVAIETVVREAKGRTSACTSFEEARNWRKQDVPGEFAFINSDTTVHELERRLGHWTRVRGKSPIQALQYNTPNEGAILIFPESPLAADSKIRGAKFFSNRSDIPLCP